LPPFASVEIYDETGAFLRSVSINPATGFYTTGKTLRAGVRYLLRVSNIPGFGTTWSGGGLSAASATAVSVTPGTITSNGDTSIALPLGGGIKGTITCAVPKAGVCTNAGDPVPGAFVSVSEASVTRFTAGATAGSGGAYDTGRLLSPGTYRVDAIAP